MLVKPFSNRSHFSSMKIWSEPPKPFLPALRLLNSSADSAGCVVKLLNSSADILQVMAHLFAPEGAMCCVGKLRPFLRTASLTAKSRASACSRTAGWRWSQTSSHIYRPVTVVPAFETVPVRVLPKLAGHPMLVWRGRWRYHSLTELRIWCEQRCPGGSAGAVDGCGGRFQGRSAGKYRIVLLNLLTLARTFCIPILKRTWGGLPPQPFRPNWDRAVDKDQTNLWDVWVQRYPR